MLEKNLSLRPKIWINRRIDDMICKIYVTAQSVMGATPKEYVFPTRSI